MPRWRVYVSYWCGFTKHHEWQERSRAVFEAEGWTEIRFGNTHTEGYVPNAIKISVFPGFSGVVCPSESKKPPAFPGLQHGENVGNRQILMAFGTHQCFLNK